jgi:hypothetical protein
LERPVFELARMFDAKALRGAAKPDKGAREAPL